MLGHSVRVTTSFISEGLFLPNLIVSQRGKSTPNLGSYHTSDVPEIYGSSATINDYILTDAFSTCIRFIGCFAINEHQLYHWVHCHSQFREHSKSDRTHERDQSSFHHRMGPMEFFGRCASTFDIGRLDPEHDNHGWYLQAVSYGASDWHFTFASGFMRWFHFGPLLLGV